MGQWFYHFLTNRKHFVRLPGGVSGDHPVISGVPQGKVLGLLLFIIIIVDINKDIACSKLISFADDTRVYNQISDTEDCDSLQRDLNSIYKWASDNNMSFNAKKFHYLPLSASQASNKSNVYINPSMDIIPQSTDVPGLGIIMSKDCSFDSHISSLSRKCKNLAGWILRSFVSHDKLTMLTLYKSLVISRLDYASQLWSPHKISQIIHIEQNLSDPILCNFSDGRGRRRSCVISHVNTGRQGTLASNGFRWKAIRLFNFLPKSICDITNSSVCSFKQRLDRYLNSIPDLPCSPGYNNNLDGGDCLQRWTLRDDLVGCLAGAVAIVADSGPL